jgi:hypothetical protein
MVPKYCIVDYLLQECNRASLTTSRAGLIRKVEMMDDTQGTSGLSLGVTLSFYNSRNALYTASIC